MDAGNFPGTTYSLVRTVVEALGGADTGYCHLDPGYAQNIDSGAEWEPDCSLHCIATAHNRAHARTDNCNFQSSPGCGYVRTLLLLEEEVLLVCCRTCQEALEACRSLYSRCSCSFQTFFFCSLLCLFDNALCCC